jgi:hypothetical protein
VQAAQRAGAAVPVRLQSQGRWGRQSSVTPLRRGSRGSWRTHSGLIGAPLWGGSGQHGAGAIFRGHRSGRGGRNGHLGKASSHSPDAELPSPPCTTARILQVKNIRCLIGCITNQIWRHRFPTVFCRKQASIPNNFGADQFSAHREVDASGAARDYVHAVARG